MCNLPPIIMAYLRLPNQENKRRHYIPKQKVGFHQQQPLFDPQTLAVHRPSETKSQWYPQCCYLPPQPKPPTASTVFIISSSSSSSSSSSPFLNWITHQPVTRWFFDAQQFPLPIIQSLWGAVSLDQWTYANYQGYFVTYGDCAHVWCSYPPELHPQVIIIHDVIVIIRPDPARKQVGAPALQTSTQRLRDIGSNTTSPLARTKPPLAVSCTGKRCVVGIPSDRV